MVSYLDQRLNDKTQVVESYWLIFLEKNFT